MSGGSEESGPQSDGEALSFVCFLIKKNNEAYGNVYEKGTIKREKLNIQGQEEGKKIIHFSRTFLKPLYIMKPRERMVKEYKRETSLV